MATTSQRVFSLNLNPASATITRLYTAPTQGFTVISQLTVYNGGAAGTFRIYVGAFDQSNANIATIRYNPPAATLAANTTYIVPGRIVLNDGGWLEVRGDNASFSFAIDAVETTITP